MAHPARRACSSNRFWNHLSIAVLPGNNVTSLHFTANASDPTVTVMGFEASSNSQARVTEFMVKDLRLNISMVGAATNMSAMALYGFASIATSGGDVAVSGNFTYTFHSATDPLSAILTIDDMLENAGDISLISTLVAVNVNSQARLLNANLSPALDGFVLDPNDLPSITVTLTNWHLASATPVVTPSDDFEGDFNVFTTFSFENVVGMFENMQSLVDQIYGDGALFSVKIPFIDVALNSCSTTSRFFDFVFAGRSGSDHRAGVFGALCGTLGVCFTIMATSEVTQFTLAQNANSRSRFEA